MTFQLLEACLSSGRPSVCTAVEMVADEADPPRRLLGDVA